MSDKLTESNMQKVLDFTYDKAINGLPGCDSAIELAESYREGTCLHAQCDSLIQYQSAKAGTSGFLTGLGGFLTMPITIPANISSVLYVQIRMIAAIAHLGGYDLKDDKVKTLIYVSLLGRSASELLKNMGIQIGKTMAKNTIKNISGKVIISINQKVGFRLVTKFGEKGVLNLGKAIPLIGGFVGGGFDIATTKIIGSKAKDIFITQ